MTITLRYQMFPRDLNAELRISEGLNRLQTAFDVPLLSTLLQPPAGLCIVPAHSAANPAPLSVTRINGAEPIREYLHNVPSQASRKARSP